MRLYLAILPSDEIIERILEARALLGIEPTKNPPHLTLRSSFTTDSYEALIEDLATIRAEPFTITLDGYTTFDDTFLVLTAEKSPELIELEAQVMRIAQRHRVFEEKPLRRPLDKREREYLATYGDPFVFELYMPHVTLAYELPEKRDVESVLELPLSFSADSIAVIEKPHYVIRDRISFAQTRST